jgi:hypothetical protein
MTDVSHVSDVSDVSDLERKLYSTSQEFRRLLLANYFQLCNARWAVIEKHVVPGLKGGRSYKTYDPMSDALSKEGIRMNKRQLNAHDHGALPGCVSNCYFRLPSVRRERVGEF